MDLYSLAFRLCSILIIPFWLLMIAAPRWHVTLRVMTSLWPIFVFALPYTLLEIPRYTSDVPLFLRAQLSSIDQLLSRQNDVVIVWLHFLAVDLLAGRWIYLDSREQDYSPWIMAPILVVCLLFCPAGIVIYLAFRMLKRIKTELPAL